RERNKFSNTIKSTYENLNINENLKKILRENKYQLSWIPYSEFEIIEEIGKGGFATVYYAKWSRLKAYSEIGFNNPSFLQCYGISQDETTKDYIIILKYAETGSLYKNIVDVSQMKWKDKLNLLNCIVSDLEAIHSEELSHRDLHSKNILQDDLRSAYIADLGLSASASIKQEDQIYGIIPYVAPEVLQGKPFTQAIEPEHPSHMYTSKLINTKEVSNILSFAIPNDI
ncbi:11424_t:CDS:2, partial [Ambispora leptoticha]